jgi:hypothetical protein
MSTRRRKWWPVPKVRTTVMAVLTAGAVTSCSSGETTSPEEVDLLPTQVLFRADAEGIADNGKRTQCWIETFIEIGATVERGGRVVQQATGGGDAFRSIDRDEDTSVQFWAHTAFADLEFHHVSKDGLMAGHRRAVALAPGELARGTWTCHPMDTPPSSGEYYDPSGSLDGTWVLRVR